MAEELDIRDIKLLEFTAVGRGFVKFNDMELGFFQKETWKLFVSTIGQRILDDQKGNIFGECLIQFFPDNKNDIKKSSKKTNKTFLMQDLLEPLFFIKYDENGYIEIIDKSGQEIPKEIFFLILCR